MFPLTIVWYIKKKKNVNIYYCPFITLNILIRIHQIFRYTPFKNNAVYYKNVLIQCCGFQFLNNSTISLTINYNFKKYQVILYFVL